MLTHHFFKTSIYSFCRQNVKRQYLQQQPISFSKFDQYNLLTTSSYQFLKKSETQQKQLMVHKGNSPASLLLKDHLHLFEQGMAELNMSQNYKAFQKLLKARYKKSFDKTKQGVQIFHLERRIKSDMRKYENRIGVLSGRYKHYPIWIPYREHLGIKTLQNYEKKGVHVDVLKESLFQKGKVWMPTRQNYLNLLSAYLDANSHQLSQVKTIADIGVGSGVLSIYLAQRLKKYQRIVGFDINPDAVETAKLNSVKLNIKNFHAYQLNILNHSDYDFLSRMENLPGQYDLIVCNPPWIVAKRIMTSQHGFQEGVYDEKQQFLIGAFRFAKTYLKKNGRLLLIYSTLSYEIGLTKNTVETLCEENKFKISNKIDIPYIDKIDPDDNLQMFKEKSKIVLYQIVHC